MPAPKAQVENVVYDWTVMSVKGVKLEKLTPEAAAIHIAFIAESAHPGLPFRPSQWKVRARGLPPGVTSMRIRRHRCAFSHQTGCKAVIREVSPLLPI